MVGEGVGREGNSDWRRGGGAEGNGGRRGVARCDFEGDDSSIAGQGDVC